MSASIDPEFAKLAQSTASDPAWQDAAHKAVTQPPDRLWGDIARFAPLGAAAMLARILLSPSPVTWGWLVRRMFAAGITGSLVGIVSQDYIHTEGLRYAAVSLSAYAAPEVWDFALRYVKAKGEAQVAKAVASKPKGKRKKK